MTPEQDPTKDDKSTDAPASSTATDTPSVSEAPKPEPPKLPVSGGSKTEDPVPSERPAITPVNINLPVVAPKKSNLKMIVLVIISLVVMAIVGFGIYTMLSMSQGATENTTAGNT